MYVKHAIHRARNTLIMCFLCLLFARSIQAQNWFVGGNVSIRSSDRDSLTIRETDHWENEVTTLSITQNERITYISPTIGYSFDKSDIGFYPILGMAKSYDEQIDTTPTVSPIIRTYSNESKTSIIGSGIFYRYEFFNIKKFSMLGRVDLRYQYSKREIDRVNNDSHPYYSIVKNTRTHTKSHFVIMSLTPVFEYHLSKNFSLFTDLNIRGMRGMWEHANQTISIVTETADSFGSTDTDIEYEERKSHANLFSFSGSSITNLSITDTISIGLIYRF